MWYASYTFKFSIVSVWPNLSFREQGSNKRVKNTIFGCYGESSGALQDNTPLEGKKWSKVNA